MTEKTKVTLIQDADGVVRRVRIGKTEITVVTAAPLVVAAGMGVMLTIAPAEVVVERDPAKA